MNQNQRYILVAVIAVIVAMIAYPPFQVIGKSGAVFNMGYTWIFDPPDRRATVTVSMLLIQWLGVLVVGGIAFFLAKGASVPSGPSHQQTTAVTPPIEEPKEKAENLYKAILGEKNRIYYLAKFKEFDQQASGLKASWNWAAFFGNGFWALYRKMYGWFFACWGLAIISGFLEKVETISGFFEAVLFIVLVFLCLLFLIAFPIYANSLYHESIKKKIAVAQKTIQDESRLLEFLRHRGGVHKWVIWVCILLPVIGILAAIAVPQFTAYKQGSDNAAELERWNAEPNSPAPSPAPAPPRAPQVTPAKPLSTSQHKDAYALLSSLSDNDFKAFANRYDLSGIGYSESEGKLHRIITYFEVDSDSVIALLDQFKKNKNIPTIETPARVPAPSTAPAQETGRDGRFIAYNNGTILDTQTNLMWAADDCGSNRSWWDAKSYCKNFRNGGYTDWRMPTSDELAGLYDAGKTNRHGYHVTDLIGITRCCPWASEIRDSTIARFDFTSGRRQWESPSPDRFMGNRVLPVRSVK